MGKWSTLGFLFHHSQLDWFLIPLGGKKKKGVIVREIIFGVGLALYIL